MELVAGAVTTSTSTWPAAPAERTLSWSSPAAKVLFVPSGAYLKMECPSLRKRFPAASIASAPAWALMETKIVPTLASVRATNFLFINVILIVGASSFLNVHPVHDVVSFGALGL